MSQNACMLFAAISRNEFDIMCCVLNDEPQLINQRQDINAIKHAQAELPLTQAAMWARDDMVRELLVRGANPNGEDWGGHTPLTIACLTGFGSAEKSTECIRLLLDAGATLDKSAIVDKERFADRTMCETEIERVRVLQECEDRLADVGL